MKYSGQAHGSSRNSKSSENGIRGTDQGQGSEIMRVDENQLSVRQKGQWLLKNNNKNKGKGCER